MVDLNDFKRLIGISEDEYSMDDKLSWILETNYSRLKNRLGGIDVPDELEYIVLELSVIRFNRIGSEGLSSHSVEGESQNWNEDDFAGFENDINDWLDRQADTRKGRVRFL